MPSKIYEKNRQQLLSVLEGNYPGLVEVIRTHLEEDFMEALGLRIDRRRIPTRVLRESMSGYGSMFDHCEEYRSGRDCVWISQPYSLNLDELKEYAARYHLEYAVAPEWSFHYPGLTTLFVLRMEFDVMELHYDDLLEKWGVKRRMLRARREEIRARIGNESPMRSPYRVLAA